MKRVMKWVAAAVVLGMALYVGIYFYGASSDAYRFSEAWLRKSEPLKSTVGEISALRLSPWGGYRERFAGSERRVWLVVEVTGSRQKVNVKLALAYDGANWQVTQSGILE